ncbi:MAG: PQQ-dependent sugar dehydrogenase [Bacteroidetes bacterium]|nr:PQQ-dependent sugar dehydrogenase [Bacteroidota bacterium]
MKKLLAWILFICLTSNLIFSQSFIRTELSTPLTNPWEITYGPDNYLWISESGGKVCRVDPSTGAKTTVFTAGDYFGGSPSEQSAMCNQPNIQSGTLGLTLHPDFLISPFIYFVYSYNSGTVPAPVTKFKIVKLSWDPTNLIVTANTDLVTNLPNGYDHIGGRLLGVKQNSVNYLYFSTGDNGISEANSPTCYNPQTLNPNNFAQDINYKNGKIHRFNMDGTIPFDNPVTGNSIFTRGHRNPQGLVFNASQNLVYNIEHGDRTDDEINVLESGKNYGWKYVRGYHADNNYPGESAYISSYTINPAITNDGLKEPLFTWCSVPQPTTGTNTDWCTVAPSDGFYYSSNAIPNWNNSILITTLKKGANTDQEVYILKLAPNGLSFAPSTSLSPNPQKFFTADQNINGRLRDITVSADGTKLFLINNGGAPTDKITVYTYDPFASVNENYLENTITIYPNPAYDLVFLRSSLALKYISIYDVYGKELYFTNEKIEKVDISRFNKGIFFLKACTEEGSVIIKKIIK